MGWEKVHQDKKNITSGRKNQEEWKGHGMDWVTAAADIKESKFKDLFFVYTFPLPVRR